VIAILAAVLSQYGTIEGTLLIFDLFAAVIIYKYLTSLNG